MISMRIRAPPYIKMKGFGLMLGGSSGDLGHGIERETVTQGKRQRDVSVWPTEYMGNWNIAY